MEKGKKVKQKSLVSKIRSVLESWGLIESWCLLIGGESDIKYLLERIKRICKDIKMQEAFARMRRMITLEFYSRVKKSWEKQAYIDRLDRKDKTGWAWFRLGLWKSRGVRKNYERGKCPLCNEEEDEYHIMLVCNKTLEWRREYIEERILKLNPKVGLYDNEAFEQKHCVLHLQ